MSDEPLIDAMAKAMIDQDDWFTLWDDHSEKRTLMLKAAARVVLERLRAYQKPVGSFSFTPATGEMKAADPAQAPAFPEVWLDAFARENGLMPPDRDKR